MASSEDELDPLERESNQAFGKPHFLNARHFLSAILGPLMHIIQLF